MEILCATDGSKGALAGPRALAALALPAASHVRLLAVLERGEANPVAWRALDAAEETLAPSGVRISRSIRRGWAADQLLSAAQEIVADAAVSGADALVVVGSKGHSLVERFFLGSVAERLVRHAPCPTLVARPLNRGLDRVVVAVDGSEGADAAVHWLSRFPLPDGCAIRLAAVLDRRSPDHGEGVRQRVEVAAGVLRAAGKGPVETDIRFGDPSAELLAAAQESAADLIVVGARGLGGFDRLLLGSVSEKLVRHAPVSVLVVRAHTTEMP